MYSSAYVYLHLSVESTGLHLLACVFKADSAEVYIQHIKISESQSELLYDWQFTANQFVLATSPLRLTTSNFIFQLNTCGYRPYVTSSLIRDGSVVYN
jgi:hypothetical protein